MLWSDLDGVECGEQVGQAGGSAGVSEWAPSQCFIPQQFPRVSTQKRLLDDKPLCLAKDCLVAQSFVS